MRKGKINVNRKETFISSLVRLEIIIIIIIYYYEFQND